MTESVYHATGNTEAKQKAGVAHLFEQVSAGKARTGVLNGLAVTQEPTASGNVLVGVGGAVVQASVIAGASLLTNDTQKTVDVLGANPMGGVARNDIVVFDSATSSVRVITGTPNVTPTDPTVPTSAVPLARLRHAGSATTVTTAGIDDLRSFTGLAARQGNPFADYSRGVGGNITRLSWVKLAYTTVNANVGGFTYASGDFTAPKDGLYDCRVQIMFSGSAGLSYIGARIDVDDTLQEFNYAAGGTAGNWGVKADRLIRLTAGQKVSFSAQHNATSDIPTQSDPKATWCQVRWVGP